mmetsp:Transcript_87830/g.243626  ORF Transcript_87830/g.243626 Transcript_87830/m.243626 type:complete len:217 (+) Transcript_87830:118-768(+)
MSIKLAASHLMPVSSSISRAMAPPKSPFPSSMPAGSAIPRGWTVHTLSSCTCRQCSVPVVAQRRMTSTATEPPRKKQMPGSWSPSRSVTSDFSFTNPTRGPNISTDCIVTLCNVKLSPCFSSLTSHERNGAHASALSSSVVEMLASATTGTGLPLNWTFLRREARPRQRRSAESPMPAASPAARATMVSVGGAMVPALRRAGGTVSGLDARLEPKA